MEHQLAENLSNTPMILPFFHDWASDEHIILSAADQAVVHTISANFQKADGVVMRIGGKAGRLGESVVETGLLEGMLLALAYVGKTGIAVSIIVDEEVAELFDERLYQQKYWDRITVIKAPLAHSLALLDSRVRDTEGSNIFVLDFHAAYDEMPRLHVQVQPTRSVDDASENRQAITILSHLARVGVRSYASRGPQRRYAAFIENLLSLPEGSVDDLQAQPRILLSEEDEERYLRLASEIQLDAHSMQIICFFQSVVVAKCYTRWDEVMMMLCRYCADTFPGRKVDFLVACGPDEQQPLGFKKEDLEEWFEGFKGVHQNARVLTYAPSLRDLAILTRHASLALSNDTGPGHIAGALQVPTVVPYLPGTLYSKKIWASTFWHHGVTLDPAPFSYQEIEAAVLWDRTDVIDAIPPEHLFDEIVPIVQSLPHL